MIIHKLLARYLKHRDDAIFYLMQAQDAVRWLEASGVMLGRQTHALDLGCGHGVFGAELAKHDCKVTFADEENGLLPELSSAPFCRFNIDRDDLGLLGHYHLVICSTLDEHLSKPNQFLQ